MTRQRKLLLVTVAGIVLLALTAVGLNAIFNKTQAGSARLDLTENKIYTLSDGTKKILAGLDTPVTIRYRILACPPPHPPSQVSHQTGW